MTSSLYLQRFHEEFLIVDFFLSILISFSFIPQLVRLLFPQEKATTITASSAEQWTLNLREYGTETLRQSQANDVELYRRNMQAEERACYQEIRQKHCFYG